MLLFQSAFTQYSFPELDKRLEAAKKELGGDAMLVVSKDGKIIYQKAVGEFNLKTQVPVGYLSKWFTAALVMSYVDAGSLSLNTKISEHLPYFSKYGKGYITIKDCLADLTGIDSEAGRGLFRKKNASLEEEAMEYASKREIVSNPGLEFRFSNIGINLVSRVMEVAFKRGFERMMQEKITRKVAMRQTSFSSLEGIDPAAGAVSTPNDVINFLNMLLGKGMFNGQQVLSEESVATMHKAFTTPSMIKYAPQTMQGYNYGLGEWIMQTDENGKATVVAMPGLNGIWPMIDMCRGYSFALFTKGKLKEEPKELVLALKEIIDAQIKPNCQ